MLNPTPPSFPEAFPWLKKPVPVSGRNGLKVFGTILMIGAAGVAAMIAGIGYAEGVEEARAAGIGVGSFIFLLGLGLVVASRFMNPPANVE